MRFGAVEEGVGGAGGDGGRNEHGKVFLIKFFFTVCWCVSHVCNSKKSDFFYLKI